MRPPVGQVGFPAVPVLVNRTAEIDRIREALDTAGTAESPLLLIRGEAGTGKTRLIQEAATEAERRGRSVVFGNARAESTAPYHLWAAPLRQLGIDYVLEDAPPPRLMGLYLFDLKGHSLARVEREPKGKSGPGAGAPTFEPEPSSPGKAILGGELSAFDRSGRRLLVLERPEIRLCAAVEGHEDESFVEDLRKLVADLEPSAAGEALRTTRSFKDLLRSGKYEGIDYAKGDPKLRQSRLFQNAALGLARNAELHPLLLVLDDLQWADPSSLALLAYVARNLRRSNVLLLGAYRLEEGSVRPHLQKALDRMAREGLFAEFGLGGLSRRDLGALAESFIGPHGLPEPFLDLLWNETGGNPLIAREVLRGLEEGEAIQLHGASKKLIISLEEISIPQRVREAVRARLGRIPKDDRRLLEAAAACGTRFTAAMVATLVGETEGNVLNGFGSIAGVHGFLRAGESDFTFDHPAVQEVLYTDMSDEVRRVYHREAAGWLELAGGPTEDVAEHLYRAKDVRAAGQLRRAAETARQRYANPEAIRFYMEALEFEKDPDTRRKILEALGSIEMLVGEFNSGLEFLARALELAKTRRDRAGILARTWEVHFAMGNPESALQDCVSALPLVEGEGVSEEALILARIGIVRCTGGNYDQGLEYLQRSLAIWEKIGDRGGIAKTLNSIGVAHIETGDFRKGLEYCQRSMEFYEELGDVMGVAKALANCGAAQSFTGDRDKALKALERSLAIWKRIGDRGGVAHEMQNVGLMHFLLGNYDRALEFLEAGISDAEKIGAWEDVANGLRDVGSLHFERGDHDKALECLERSLATSETVGDRRGVAAALNAIGNVHMGQADYNGALERLTRSLDMQEKMGDQAGVAGTLVDLAELRLETGDLATAERCCERALSLSIEVGDKESTAKAMTAFGILHKRRDAWQKSSACFEESLRIFAQVGRPFLQGIAQYEFGLMCKQAGDAANAKQHLSIAAGIFEKLKLAKELRKVAEASQDLPAK